MNQSEQISFRRKCGLCAAAWIAAIIGMALVERGFFSREGFLLPPVFSPAGFPVFLFLAYCDPSSNASTVIAAIVGWLYYVILTTWSLCAIRRMVFIRVFAVLCVSLLLNIAGCEAVTHADWRTDRDLLPNKSLKVAAAGVAENAN